MLIGRNKGLKAIIMMFIQKKLIRLQQVLMRIRDYKHMIRLQHTHMEQMLLKYVKVKCYIIEDLFYKIRIKMINFEDYVNENKTKHNKNWPYIPDHPCRILIIGDSGSGKTNLLLNLIENQPDIDKIYLYAKDPYESKYQYLINKRESVGINHFHDPKAFIEYSNDMHYVYKNIDDYNPDKENKILIVFDDMIADMDNNNKLNSKKKKKNSY